MSESPETASPRKTPFQELEQARGARFGEVSGWLVPRGYEDDAEGVRAAREGVAILDLSATGRIKITGKDRVNLLQRISTNDLRPLEGGRLAPTLFVTAKGRIVDRAHVLDRGETLLLLTAPGGRERLVSHVARYVLADDFRMTDVSTESAAFALLGPRVNDLLKKATGVGLSSLEPGRFVGLPIEGVDTLIAPYDPLPGARILIGEVPGIVAVFDRMLAGGDPLGLAPLGYDAAEVLRIEAGIPGEGHELTESWNPWEARLEGSFSLSKGCYTGQEVIARLNTYDKIQKRLVGVRMGQIDPPILPQNVHASKDGGSEREIGALTSAVRSERLSETIGLAFVRRAYEAPGTKVLIGESRLPAAVSELPFI